jgi:hypothetical protein
MDETRMEIIGLCGAVAHDSRFLVCPARAWSGDWRGCLAVRDWHHGSSCHSGKHSGCAAMSSKEEFWLGIIAIAVFVLCVTGLAILYLHAMPVLINL